MGRTTNIGTATNVADDDPALFEDHDAVRGDGRGFYVGDESERWSRRVDLRGPTDVDPGPIPLDEAPAHLIGAPPARAVVLRMPRRRS